MINDDSMEGVNKEQLFIVITNEGGDAQGG